MDASTTTGNSPNAKNEEFKFRFKKDEMGNQRPSLSLFGPVPTLAEIARLALTTKDLVDKDTKQVVMQDGKPVQVPSNEAELIHDAVYGVIQDQIRSLVNDDEKASQDNFKWSEATFEFIANMPPSARRGAGIPKESWEDFAKNYIEIMPAVTSKTKEQCAQAAQIFVRKFRDAAGNLPVVEKLQTYLAMYTEAPGNKAEEYPEIIEFLLKKSTDMLAAKDKVAVLENL